MATIKGRVQEPRPLTTIHASSAAHGKSGDLVARASRHPTRVSCHPFSAMRHRKDAIICTLWGDRQMMRVCWCPAEHIRPDAERIEPAVERIEPNAEFFWPDPEHIEPDAEQIEPDAERIEPDAEFFWLDAEFFWLDPEHIWPPNRRWQQPQSRLPPRQSHLLRTESHRAAIPAQFRVTRAMANPNSPERQ
ncbi:MAG: hypothetical protein KF757_07400 [Phycisphaeraceae bacterium]|nr:hypothetical protein [Phycisphaeraceae bacterium]